MFAVGAKQSVDCLKFAKVETIQSVEMIRCHPLASSRVENCVPSSIPHTDREDPCFFIPGFVPNDASRS